jgi:hypothetical protein
LTQHQIGALRAPFPAEERHWRAGATNKKGTKALALAHINARAVMDRLDEAVGRMHWAYCCEEWRSGSVKAGIGVRDSETGEWV